MSNPVGSNRVPGRQSSDARDFFGEEKSPTSRRKKKKRHHQRTLGSSDGNSNSCPLSRIYKKRKPNHRSAPTSIYNSVPQSINHRTLPTYRQSTMASFLTGVQVETVYDDPSLSQPPGFTDVDVVLELPESPCSPVSPEESPLTEPLPASPPPEPPDDAVPVPTTVTAKQQ